MSQQDPQNTSEPIHNAVAALAQGDGNLRERLLSAWDALGSLNDSDFVGGVEKLLPIFEEIQAMYESVGSPLEEGLADLSDDKARGLAHKILELLLSHPEAYLYC